MSVDWHSTFTFSLSPLEIVVRGTAFFWFLFLLVRVVVRRRLGSIGVADILIIVIIADASQNAMTGGYKSVVDGMLLVSTLVAWAVFIDWLCYVWPAAERVLLPHALRLIHRGRILRRNLRAEFISEEELWSKLREHGITDLAEVDSAFMENDGEVSVIRRRPPRDASPR